MSQTTLFPETHGATFSPCRTWRYALWRRWSKGPSALWLMLNPSTADESSNDSTVERCQRRTCAMGYGAIWVANIFALRSTDPNGLYTHPDPIGPDNDTAIRDLASQADIVVCGWGNHGGLMQRGAAILKLLHSSKVAPYCLSLTGAGQPGHPLYISYKHQPFRMPVAP